MRKILIALAGGALGRVHPRVLQEALGVVSHRCPFRLVPDAGGSIVRPAPRAYSTQTTGRSGEEARTVWW